MIPALWAAAALAAAIDPSDVLPPQKRMESALLEAVHASCPALSVTVDPALARAAARFARAVEDGTAAPSTSALAFFASLESAEPAPVAGVAINDPASEADRAVGELFSRACRFNRFGVAAARYKDGAAVALVTVRHELDADPIPGSAELGDEITVRGELPKGMRSPKLFVLKPDGSVEQQQDIGRIRNGPKLAEGRFFAKVRFDERGEHSIEVLADSNSGPQVLLLRRVFVAIDPPDAPPPEVAPAATGDDERGVDAVYASMAALRAARGLPPIVRDSALEKIALGHSQQMARARIMAHVLKADGTLTDRLDKAGYAQQIAAENVALAETPMMAHGGILLSPAHLANLLDPRFRRVGVGAVAGPTPEGPDGVYLTEVFALPIVGLDDPAGEVIKVLQAARRKATLQPLMRDRRLDAVAEAEVRRAAFAGDPPRLGDAASPVRNAAPQYFTSAAELAIGDDAHVVLKSRLVGEPWTNVGVGAMYATSKTLGPGKLWVVVIFAR